MAGLAGALLSAALLGWAQYSPSNGGVLGQNLPGTRQQNGLGTMESDPIWGEKRLRALNADRHKAVVSDTDKLLKLARQLDAEIASNTTEELTAEELRKVGEIEKLAHNVKAKMAQSFGEAPQFRQSTVPLGGPSRP